MKSRTLHDYFIDKANEAVYNYYIETIHIANTRSYRLRKLFFRNCGVYKITYNEAMLLIAFCITLSERNGVRKGKGIDK